MDIPEEFKDWHEVPVGATIPPSVPYFTANHYQNQLVFMVEGTTGGKLATGGGTRLYTKQKIELPSPKYFIPNHVLVLKDVECSETGDKQWSGAVRTGGEFREDSSWILFDANRVRVVAGDKITAGKVAVLNQDPMAEDDKRDRILNGSKRLIWNKSIDRWVPADISDYKFQSLRDVVSFYTDLYKDQVKFA